VEDKNSDPKPPQKQPERKPTAAGGNNMVWVLLGIGIVTLALVSMFGADTGETIDYGQLR
jgi:hypothetical protein